MNVPATQVVSPTALLTGNEARAYAKTLSESTMVSPFFRGSVPNMLYAMELGKLYNLEPAAVLQNVHVFETVKDGKTTLKAGLSANLMVTLARHAGHLVNTTPGPSRASTIIVRGDTIFGKLLKGAVDKEELAHYATILQTLKDLGVDAKKMATTETFWNEEKAVTAGLFGKGNWAKYPHSMLAARAKTDCVRAACEEVLIQLSNNASRVASIHGPLTTADGQEIDVHWGHTADELEASVTDEGELVTSPGSSSQNGRAQATVTRPRQGAPATDATSAKADIAAQAASNPAQAGWGKPPEEPKPRTVADNVRDFVTSKPYEEVVDLLVKSVTADDKDERKTRMLMIAVPAAETMDLQQLHGLLVQVSEHQPDLTQDFLTAVADSAPASRIAELLQDISLDADVAREDRLETMRIVYQRLKEKDRVDDPAPFYDKAAEQERSTSLGGAVRTLIQPLVH